MSEDYQYLSYSGFKKYVACPQAYYLEYVAKKLPPVQDSRNTLRGNTMHTLLEEYIERGVNDTSWLIENVDRIWNQLVSDSYVVWKHKDDEEVLKEKLYLWTRELARLMDEDLGFDVTKVESELKADSYIQLGNYKVLMGGRLDIVMKDKNGDHAFFDLKASENKAVMEFDQIVWYSVVMGLHLGDTSQPKLGGYILPGFKSVKMYQVPDEAKKKLLQRLHKVVDQIQNEVWTPNPEKSKCWWCPVSHACPVVGKAIPHKSGMITIG